VSYEIRDGALLLVASNEEKQARGLQSKPFSDVLDKLNSYPKVGWNEILRGQFEAADADAISYLKAALYDNDAIVQQQAAKALYWVHQSAKSTIPDLKKLARSNDWQVRRAAYFALASIGGSDLSTFSFLVDAWDTDEVIQDDWFLLIREFDND